MPRPTVSAAGAKMAPAAVLASASPLLADGCSRPLAAPIADAPAIVPAPGIAPSGRDAPTEPTRLAPFAGTGCEQWCRGLSLVLHVMVTHLGNEWLCNGQQRAERASECNWRG